MFKSQDTQYLHLFHLLKLLEGVYFNDVVIQVIDIKLGGKPDLVTGVIPDINTLIISLVIFQHTTLSARLSPPVPSPGQSGGKCPGSSASPDASDPCQ